MTTRLGRTTLAAALFLAATSRATAESPANELTGSLTTHVVVQGDTLFSLGARAGVDVAALAADNGLDRRQPLVVGQRLTIDNRHIVTRAAAADIVVNLPQRMLFFFADEI